MEDIFLDCRGLEMLMRMKLVGAAREIVQDGEQLYLGVVKPGFDGIQLAKLKFAPQ